MRQADASNLFNTGKALFGRGQLDLAAKCYREAIRLEPANPETHFHLGNALFVQGKIDEAGDAYREAIRLKPDYAEAHLNLANVLRPRGKLDEAIAAYRQAIRLVPGYAKAHSNLGVTLQEQGRLTEAVAEGRHAISLQPDLADAHSNLAVALWHQGKLDEAAAAFRRAIAIQPDHARAFSCLLFCLEYDDSLTDDLFTEHRAFGARFGRPPPERAAYANQPDPERRLRIGYVSPDFRWHSVAFFVEPLLKEHDRRAMEVFCYADVMQPDGATAYLQGFADHWLASAWLSDDALGERIRQDEIDILVDLAGHTANNRLGVFARKPAPVQVTWLGYPNTTGLSAIDYRLVDAVTDPPGEADAAATETLVRLDGGFLCYGGVDGAAEPKDPPCLTAGAVTFGSFNNPAKLSGATYDAWAALLARLPQSRLLLKGSSFADPDTRALFLARFVDRGVTTDRVELMPRLTGADAHLSAYHQVDIALDPFPYNGATTTCEALWMGVPVVTLRGNRHAGRVGASLLTQVGLTELITNSVEEYIETAIALARDPTRLASLRQSLRPRMTASPLCDSRAFARKMEAAFRTMWRRWCEAPA
jgi:protein O-GlcNAc transferase